MKTNSAAFQKLKKLEINDLEDAIEENPFPSYLEDISKISGCLHLAMCSAKLLPYSPTPEHNSLSDSIDYLRYLVNSLCKVLNFSELDEPHMLKHQEKPPTFSVLNKMLRVSSDGIYLKPHECKEICSIIFGDIRDVEHNALKEKIMKTQKQIVKYSKTIFELRVKLEEKEKELISVYDDIDRINQEMSTCLLTKYKSPISTTNFKFSGESTCASINIPS